MGFLGWIVIGGIAGWLASLIMKTNDKQGLFLNIVVGIIGGYLGGWLLGVVGIGAVGFGILGSLITAVLGACVLLLLVKLISGRKH
jgi:uncharacterized membrane protein YeaQ/YmgE (transglycosylase-associated protein family)